MEQHHHKLKVMRRQIIERSGLTVNQYNYLRDKKVFPIEEESAGPGFPVIYSEEAIQIAKKHLQKRNPDHGSGRSKNYALADDTRGSNSSQVQHIINKSDDTKRDAEMLSSKEREETDTSHTSRCVDNGVSYPKEALPQAERSPVRPEQGLSGKKG